MEVKYINCPMLGLCNTCVIFLMKKALLFVCKINLLAIRSQEL